MGYEVRVLTSATDFLETLEVKLKAKTYRSIKLLQEFGPFLSEPHSKKIKGFKSLYELRVKQGSNICRLFYFHHKGKVYVVTSGFIKKENKTNKNELVKAEKIMNKFMEDYHE